MIDFKTEILAPVAEDFQALDAFIAHGVHSKVPLVMAVSRHVVEAGGKRLRPLMCLLAGRACAPEQPRPDSMVKLAALVEMLHTATLVHDDVVDASGLRRGVPTAHVTWDNPTAVLVGDFLIARAFHLMVGLGQMDLLEDFSAGTCEIAEGEVLQLQHQHHPDASEADYLQIIYGKTSRLFMMACEGAAMLAGQPQYREGLRAFAAHFGNAFQIIDDILDYSSDAETLGKNIGDDLMEGKPTLPLIAALQRTDGADRELIRRSIQTGGTQDLARIIALVHQSGALDYCRLRASEETASAIQALHALPDSVYRQALMALGRYAQDRLS